MLIIAGCEVLLYVDVQNRIAAGVGTVVAHDLLPSELPRPTDPLGWAGRWAAVNMTPLCWFGYLLALDGILHALGGWRDGSPLRRRPNRFVLAWLTSIPVWCFFDWVNFASMDAWRYHGLPPAFGQRLVGYFVAFATISPGMFLTAALVMRALPRGTGDAVTQTRRSDLLAWVLVLVPPALIAAALLCLLPTRDNHLSDTRGVLGTMLLLVGPAAAALYRTRSPRITSFAIGVGFTAWSLLAQDPLANLTLWTGLIYLLDPINAAMGAPSLIRDWQAGRWQRSVALGAGGLLCGFLWEFWNYWAVAKWTYRLPFLGPLEEVRYFEMPVLGLLGFIPFAGECWVMLNTIAALHDRARLNVAEPLPDERSIL